MSSLGTAELSVIISLFALIGGLIASHITINTRLTKIEQDVSWIVNIFLKGMGKKDKDAN